MHWIIKTPNFNRSILPLQYSLSTLSNILLSDSGTRLWYLLWYLRRTLCWICHRDPERTEQVGRPSQGWQPVCCCVLSRLCPYVAPCLRIHHSRWRLHLCSLQPIQRHCKYLYACENPNCCNIPQVYIPTRIVISILYYRTLWCMHLAVAGKKTSFWEIVENVGVLVLYIYIYIAVNFSVPIFE